jgi:hypothetical protein
MAIGPSLEDAIAILVGNPLSGTFRAADMEMFEFGEQLPFVDRHGNNRTRGQYRLHVQCPWRIVRSKTVLLGYDDMVEPPRGVSANEFDPNAGGKNLRDELMAEFLRDTSIDGRTVRRCAATELGDVQLTFGDNSRLELFPAASNDEAEYWRLLLPDGSHLVMSGAGLERLPPIRTHPNGEPGIPADA